MPSGRDYLKRPQWQTDADLSKGPKKKEVKCYDMFFFKYNYLR